MTNPSRIIDRQPPQSAYRWLTAPPFDCAACARRIGRDRTHYQLSKVGNPVVCIRCAETRTLHSKFFPDCPHQWHDLFDHLDRVGTRAGIAAALGLWPARKGTP